MKLFLFGQPHIQRDGHHLPISRRKSLALLAYLAVTGQPHSRDFLATLFWPEGDQSSARNNLRGILFDLKNSLGDQIIRIEREEIAIHPDAGLWVDVCEFQNRLAANRDLHRSDSDETELLPDRSLADLTAAAGLYSADFMTGFSAVGSREYEDWQFFIAENLRQMFAELLQALITWHSRHEQFDTALFYARRWLALDPLHEPAQRELMRLYELSGQHAAALRQYQECVRLLNDELGAEPEPETIALYDAIRTRRFAKSYSGGTKTVEGTVTKATLHRHLPGLNARLVGRDGELAYIIKSLRDEPDCRLMTLVGLGGIGKTSLAIAAASELADDPACPFCDGIFFVSLVALSQDESIIPAIAAEIQLPLLADIEDRNRQLRDYLQHKRTLLVLDNFEHLITPQSIRLLVDLLSYARQVKLLVTSRMRLNAHFERILPLESLDVPQLAFNLQAQSIEQIVVDYSAVQLFAQRARSAKPDFAITTSNLQAVIQVCRLVEGLPLGIELAAAWLEVFSVAEIAKEITDCLDFLEASWPDRPERHHSLRAIFDSSWRLLPEPERTVLMSLTLFHGSFSRQAAQAVSGASIHSLLALQNKSWLQYKDDGRFQIHELLRQYATEKLQEDPSVWMHNRETFANYYAAFLNDMGQKIKGSDQKGAFDSIAVEFENIRLAWQILVENQRIEFAVDNMLFALFRYAEVRVEFFDIKPLLDLGIREIGKDTCINVNSNLLATLLICEAISSPYGGGSYSYFLLMSDRQDTIRRAWRLTGGNIEVIKGMGNWGILLCFLIHWIDEQRAIKCLYELQSYFREQNCRWELANALNSLAPCLMKAGSNESHRVEFTAVELESEQLLVEALMIFDELGDVIESERTRSDLGQLYADQGKFQEAIVYLQTALANLKDLGETYPLFDIEFDLALTLIGMGDYTSAFQYFHSIRQRQEDIGDKTGVAFALSEESMQALRFSSLDHARQTRLESLSAFQEVNSANGVAWSTWEMGEVYRVASDLANAREWFEKARVLFEDLGDPTSPIFTERGLGDIAQMAGDYPTALKNFEASLQHAIETKHEWAQVYALWGMGRAEVALKNADAAKAHFSQALQTARQIRKPEMVLLSMAGFAGYFAATNQYELAVELGSMVASHKRTWNETKSQMNTLLGSITNLPDDRFYTAQERGKALTIDQAILRFNL